MRQIRAPLAALTESSIRDRHNGIKSIILGILDMPIKIYAIIKYRSSQRRAFSHVQFKRENASTLGDGPPTVSRSIPTSPLLYNAIFHSNTEAKFTVLPINSYVDAISEETERKYVYPSQTKLNGVSHLPLAV